MLTENIRNLHLMMGKNSMSAFSSLNLVQFRKKYPGHHVAIVRPEDKESAEAIGIFSEIHELNLSYIQRSSFSPLLGDEVAFHTFFNSLNHLAAQKWSRLFNLKGSGVDNALSELFSTEAVIGTCTRGQERRCQEPPLKLSALLEQWGMKQAEIQHWLMSKCFGQLEWTAVEVCLQKVIEAKAIKAPSPLKNLIVGINLTEMQASYSDELALLQQLFTIVDIEQEHPAMRFFADILVGVPTTEWNYGLPLTHVDPDSLADLLPEAINRSLTKWANLSALFDYLGNARAALAAEKIMGRYDRDALQQFLLDQVMALKAFAKILLDGIRRPASNAQEALAAYWANHKGVITFAAAIELSIQPSISPLLRNEQDLLAIKRRMRTLNQFFERIHRACAIEIPKTDLELTL